MAVIVAMGEMAETENQVNTSLRKMTLKLVNSWRFI